MSSMRVRITFSKPYAGGIYSNLYYNNKDCIFVPWGGSDIEYEFELTVDQCGTTFRTELGRDEAANLENIIVLQLDPEIQGKWDSARRLQCTWADRLNHTVSHGFQMDVLDTVTVKFSGDNVNADMDIEVGRGPFAPRAEGLIKIGELLTLVIYIYGGNNMDVDIRQCFAHNGDKRSALSLSDNRGCIIKKNLMGAWQFTRDTGSTGATIIAFAHMQAFRFPDKTDVYIECNLEICKGACPDHCPEYPPLDLRSNLKRRRRRRRNLVTTAEVEPGTSQHRQQHQHNNSQKTTLLRSFRVLTDSDVTLIDDKPIESGPDRICMSVDGFAVGLTAMVVLLLLTCISGLMLCCRMRGVRVGRVGQKHVLDKPLTWTPSTNSETI